MKILQTWVEGGGGVVKSSLNNNYVTKETFQEDALLMIKIFYHNVVIIVAHDNYDEMTVNASSYQQRAHRHGSLPKCQRLRGLT
jgi:hypothetical protein